MDVSGLMILLNGSRQRQYRYEISFLIRRAESPFVELRYRFTNLTDVLRMLNMQRRSVQMPVVPVAAIVPLQREFIIDREFLPQNFAYHNENVMTTAVVTSVKQTIDFLICKVEIDPRVNTVQEIKKAFDENETIRETISKYLPILFLLFAGCTSIGLYHIDAITDLTAIFMFIFSGVFCFMFGKPNRINRHMEYMYTHSDNVYFMQYGIDITYKQLLDLMWGYIRSHKHRKELIQRLRQEISDGMHVCYHGNMARLANVLQGFEEELHPPISGEVVQITISRIASMDISKDEKIRIATDSLMEFGLNESQRESWIIAIQDS